MKPVTISITVTPDTVVLNSAEYDKRVREFTRRVSDVPDSEAKLDDQTIVRHVGELLLNVLDIVP